MPRQNTCARNGGKSVGGLSAKVPLRVVSASLLVLVAGGTAALAQGQLPDGPGVTPAPMVAPPTPGNDNHLSETGNDSTVVTPTQGFPDSPVDEAPRTATAEPKEDSQVKVDDNLVVDLHVNDEELSNVLQMLSIQSQRNIVASNSVNARVKADLYGVTFYEALDAILHVNGYGYIDRGNFIYVYTLEELQQIEKAARVRVSKVIKLNYLNSIDAAEFVKPLLSEGAQIKTNGKTKDFTINNVPMGADEFAHDATLVVYDYEENLAEIEKLVRELDTRPAQVLIEATILQTQLNEANAFGVDFALIADMNFLDFATVGGPESVVNNLISGKVAPDDDIGRGIVSTPGNTAGRGTMKVGVIANDVAAFVKLLDETNDTTIISNPKVLALNRAQTRVLVGRKVGYLSTTSTDTTTTQSVEFLDTGTQLTVRPFISADGMIRMELKPQVSEAVIRDTKDATGAAVTIPDEITNELNTNVMVRDGQTIVLGGLFRESTQASRRQVPFLGDIPILGSAFRGNDDETNRSEIIFLITPSIVNDNVLLSQGEAAKDYVERARAGSREGLLPWSREKMTSMGLVEAQKLAAKGETQKALWKIQQSLTLNPAQPDAIAMRERLTNERSVWPSRNLLDVIIHDEAAIKIGQPKASVDVPILPPVVTAPPAPAAITPTTTPAAEPAPTPVTDATQTEVDISEVPASDAPAPVEPVSEAPPVPTDPPQPDPQPETPPQQMATSEVSPARPFPENNGAPGSDGVSLPESVATVSDEGQVSTWTAPHTDNTSSPVAMVAGESLSGTGLVSATANHPAGELSSVDVPPAVTPELENDPHAVPTTAPGDYTEVLDPHATVGSSATYDSAPIVQPGEKIESAVEPYVVLDPHAQADPPAGESAPDIEARAAQNQLPGVAAVPSRDANGIRSGGVQSHAAASPNQGARAGAPLAPRRVRPLPHVSSSAKSGAPVHQSDTSSGQTHNSTVASSDYLNNKPGGSRGGIASPRPPNSSTGIVLPSHVPRAAVQAGQPPDPGGVNPANAGDEKQRVASALKVMNFSWRIMRVMRPGSQETQGEYTEVPVSAPEAVPR